MVGWTGAGGMGWGWRDGLAGWDEAAWWSGGYLTYLDCKLTDGQFAALSQKGRFLRPVFCDQFFATSFLRPVFCEQFLDPVFAGSYTQNQRVFLVH